MTSKTSELLYDLIYQEIKSNISESNSLIEQLKNETSQTFDDVDKWVVWFLSQKFDDKEKEFIKLARRIYKVHTTR